MALLDKVKDAFGTVLNKLNVGTKNDPTVLDLSPYTPPKLDNPFKYVTGTAKFIGNVAGEVLAPRIGQKVQQVKEGKSFLTAIGELLNPQEAANFRGDKRKAKIGEYVTQGLSQEQSILRAKKDEYQELAFGAVTDRGLTKGVQINKVKENFVKHAKAQLNFLGKNSAADKLDNVLGKSFANVDDLERYVRLNFKKELADPKVRSTIDNWLVSSRQMAGQNVTNRVNNITDDSRRVYEEQALQKAKRSNLLKPQRTEDILVGKINVNPDDYVNATKDVKAGSTSMTNKNVLLMENADGTFDVLDGHHRLVEHLQRNLGQKIKADIIPLDSPNMPGSKELVRETLRNQGKFAGSKYVPREEAAGAFAGVEIERDDQGKVTGVDFDPVKAGLGILGFTVAKRTGLVGGNKEKERKFIETVRNSKNTIPEVATAVKGSYVPITNQATLNKAQQLIAENIDDAIRIAKSPGTPTAESNAIAQQLIYDFQKAGRYQDAIDIVEITAKKATSQGQAIQALSMYNRLSPEGILRYIQRVLDKTTGGKITPEFADDVVRHAENIQKLPEGSRQKIVETAKLINKIQELVPSNLLKKVSEIQTMGQLLNPKTWIRNIVGNAGFAGLEQVSDVVGAALDSPISLITGTRTKVAPSLFKQASGFKKGWVEGLDDALKGVDTARLPTQFDLPRTPALRGKVGRAANKLLNIELRATDRAFYKAAYDGSVYQQLKAYYKTTGQFLDTPTEAMKEIAHHDGLYRTFQDDNVVSKLFSSLKKGLNVGKDFGLGDIVLKYPKTPGALISRGIEYSPGGFVYTLYEAAKPLMGKSFNQKAFVESFSRAITGTTLLVGTGALMHRLGIITGERENSGKARALQRVTGLGAYRINVSALKRFVLSGMDKETAKRREGDTMINYDWFQPQAVPMAMGANIDEGASTQNTIMSKLLTAIGEGLDTIGEQPLVKGLSNIFRTQGLSGTWDAIIKNTPSSFVPTILNQIKQLADNTARNTYSPDTLQYAFNIAKNKIPGWAGTLPPQVDVFGNNIETYQGQSNNLFNVFFNPAFKSNFATTPEAKMVLDIFEQTGETGQIPRIAPNKIKIQKEGMEEAIEIQLTPTQVTAYQRYIGTVSKKLFESFANDARFQQLPDEEKVSYLSNIITDIATAGKVIILGHRPSNMSNRTQQIIQQYR